MRVFMGDTVRCNDSLTTVFVDEDNNPGIVELEVVRTDYNGEGERRQLAIELDSTQIDALIKDLLEAKAVAEAELDKTPGY